MGEFVDSKHFSSLKKVSAEVDQNLKSPSIPLCERGKQYLLPLTKGGAAVQSHSTDTKSSTKTLAPDGREGFYEDVFKPLSCYADSRIPRKFLFSILVFVFAFLACPAMASELSGKERVVAAVKNLESAFNTLKDYTCEVEQVFYREGAEDQRFRFKLLFKKEDRLRIDFSDPYPTLTVLYRLGEREVTVIPFRLLPGLRFRPSIDNPRLRTIAGQRIDQAYMGYFINFLNKNLEKVVQREEEFYEGENEVRFVLRCMDYLDGKNLEEYRISLSRKYWLPVHVERYSAKGVLIEVTDIRNYAIDTRLEDKLFGP